MPDLSLRSICKVCNSKICKCSIPNVIYQLTCNLCTHNKCSIPNVIYQLTCNLCTHNNSIYIGETSKTAHKRLVEHGLATCNKNVNLSSIAEHFNLYHNSHILSKDKPLLSLKIIDRANNYTERKIKEAVWINKLKPTLYKNTGLELTYLLFLSVMLCNVCH